MEAVEKLAEDGRRIGGRDNEALIRDRETRLKDAYRLLDEALEEYRGYLRQLALNYVEDSRARIHNDVAEAHLSIARLQDVSLTRERLLPGDALEGPTQ
jgi:hypothetical protein